MDNKPHQEFLEWYRPLHEGFTRFCSSQAFGIMDAEDLVQESLLATLQSFHKIKNKELLLSYLFSVASNIVKNKKRRLKFSASWDEQIMEKLESRVDDPETALDIHYLYKAIEQLPANQREAIVLFEISGFSVKEIAKIQQSSTEAVKTRLSRSRKKLKEMLSDQESKLTLSQRLAIYSSILF